MSLIDFIRAPSCSFSATLFSRARRSRFARMSSREKYTGYAKKGCLHVSSSGLEEHQSALDV
jgi:hypothetical protein